MVWNTSEGWADGDVAAYDYRSAPPGVADRDDPRFAPDVAAGAWTDDVAGSWDAEPEPAAGREPKPKPKPAKSRVDEWMEVEFKFGGSRIKRKAPALILLGLPVLVPLFFMLPALISLNSNTFSGSVDDTLGTGAELALFLCLLITPLVTLTGQRWFVPLRRWYGITIALIALGDAIGAGITDTFAGGVFGRLAGHVFELMGLLMVVLLVPLLATGNPWAQRKLGRYWKRLHRIIYVIWALLFLHLVLLEGFGFQSGSNGSGNAGDGDPVFHQRMYQFTVCSLFLLVLRLPPVKRWIDARQKEGRGWLVWLAVIPLFALFVFGFTFMVNEEIFKGIDSFTEHPSSE